MMMHDRDGSTPSFVTTGVTTAPVRGFRVGVHPTGPEVPVEPGPGEPRPGPDFGAGGGDVE
jgi:hypothetical protein